MKKKILVIGATGLIGRSVAQQLNIDGYRVIVMSRNRQKANQIFSDEIEIIEADVLKPDTIKYAFEGIEGIYISLPEKDIQEALINIIEIAGKSGIKHIIYTSGCTVRKENAWHPMIKGHYDAENILKNSKIPYTIFKLTMVMDMIPRYANNGKPFIIGKQRHGWSWIYSGDIAKMASSAFENNKVKNTSLTIFGPDKLTIAEAVDQYNLNFNPGTKPAKSKPYWLANILNLIIGTKLKYAISIFKYFENHPEEGDTEKANTLLGKPQTGIREYIRIEKKYLS